jgi:hypothetical protein
MDSSEFVRVGCGKVKEYEMYLHPDLNHRNVISYLANGILACELSF